MKYYTRFQQVIVCLGLMLLGTAAAAPDHSEEELRDAIRWRVEQLEILNAADQEQVHAVASIRQLYAAYSFDRLWEEERRISDFILLINDADQEGLNPEDYHLLRIKTLLNSEESDLQQLAEVDLLLTDAFLLYASHLLSGKVDPVSIGAEWHVSRREGDPVQLFRFAVEEGDYAAVIQNILPRHPAYTELKKGLMRYREIAGEGGWKAIGSGPDILPGMRDERIPLIRRRILMTDPYPQEQGNDTSTLYDPGLTQAVLGFQRRHGFPGDGKIDAPTLLIMNVPVGERIRQIEINMERTRWLPQEFGDYYALVNIADFSMELIKPGKAPVGFRIIAGKPARKTPAFSSRVSYLVLNPTWTIPPTILLNDVLPEARKSAEFLTSRNIRVFQSDGTELNVDSIQWDDPGVTRLIYRQDPGPGNALGVVKFMFPNNFNIYLHDTPSRELFKRTDRAFSSGCIRMEHPLELASILLEDLPEWNEQTIRTKVESGETTTIMLKTRPEIYILYMTCWPREGILLFRKDIYERDQRLYQALKEHI